MYLELSIPVTASSSGAMQQRSLFVLREKWAMWQYGSSAQFQLLVANINGAVKVPSQQCLCRAVTFQV